MNKLERKAYQQINLNEGLVSVIAKFFLGSKFRDAMRELERMKKDDPELKADMASLAQNFKMLNKTVERLENKLNS
jgi:hypothetical protein